MLGFGELHIGWGGGGKWDKRQMVAQKGGAALESLVLRTHLVWAVTLFVSSLISALPVLLPLPLLQYKIDKAEWKGRLLNLSVWHHDSLSRNLFLGEVEIELEAWDWSNTGPQWFILQPRVNLFGLKPSSLAGSR